MKSGSRSLQLEKACEQQLRPRAAINKQMEFLKTLKMNNQQGPTV